MLSWFRKTAQDRETAVKIYGATVTQSRNPVFFQGFCVEDTPEGRASNIIVHLFLVMDRLNKVKADGQGPRIARLISEAFITDMDDCMREMGVGDLSVPKKVKRTAQAMGERSMAYQKAQRESPEALATMLSETVPGLAARPEEAARLARYVIDASQRLANQPDAAILDATLDFPLPG